MAKSPVQEASDSCSGSGKDSSVECEVCGDKFDSELSKNIHAGKVHKSNLEKECPWCGEEFEIYPSNEGDRKYCSEPCRDKANGEQRKKERVKNECEECGDKYDVIITKADKRRFCSTECKNQNRISKVEKNCETCGKSYKVIQARSNETKYCSQECMYEGQTGLFALEDNPNWKGGCDREYGQTWRRVRKKAKERDGYECVICSSDEWLDVHHIIPVRLYDNNKEAHKLDNAVTLCRKCHGKWEGLCLIPDIR